MLDYLETSIHKFMEMKNEEKTAHNSQDSESAAAATAQK